MNLAIPLLSLLANYLKTVSTRDSENLVIYELVNVSFLVFFITNIFQIVSSFSNLIPILSVTSFEGAIRYGYVYSLVSVSYTHLTLPTIYSV